MSERKRGRWRVAIGPPWDGFISSFKNLKPNQHCECGCLYPFKIFSTSEGCDDTEKRPHMFGPIRSKRTISDPNNPKKLHGNKTLLRRGPTLVSHDCTVDQ